MPRLAPVTTATLPASEPMLSSSSSPRQDQSFQIAFISPLLQQPLEGYPAGSVGFARVPSKLLRALAVEIAGRAFTLELRDVDRGLADVADPSVLGRLARLHDRRAARERLFDDVSDVMAVPTHLLRGAGIQSTLDKAGEELVGKAAGHHAMERLVALGPVIVDRPPAPPFDHVDAPAAIEVARDLEAAGEDHAVNLVFDTMGDESFPGHPFHAPAR